MNEAIQKFQQEVKEKIATIFEGEEFKKFLETTKAAEDTGTFEVVISTADMDRQGESIDQAGCDNANYLKNPVVLWGHDYYSLPIGICETLTLDGGRLIAKGRFAPEAANPFAQQVRRLYDAGIVRATSVGLIVKEMNGNVITKWELLEFSFVPVPANPYALSLSKAQELNLDLAMIATKGLKLEVKEEPKAAAVGDECSLEGGEVGTMQDDGNGGMVCKPKAKAVKDIIIYRAEKAIQFKYQDDSLSEKTSVMPALIELFEKAFPVKDQAQTVGAILAELSNIVSDAVVRASQLILGIVQSEFGKSAEGKEQIKAAEGTMNAIKTKFAELEKILKAGEGEDRADGLAPKQRSEDPAADGMKDLNDFLLARQPAEAGIGRCRPSGCAASPIPYQTSRRRCLGEHSWQSRR